MQFNERVYGYAPNVPIKIVSVRAVHSIAGLTDLDETGWRPKNGLPVKRSAPILVGTGEPVTATVYDRAALPTGFNFAGPAIIEQSDTDNACDPGLARPCGRGRQYRFGALEYQAESMGTRDTDTLDPVTFRGCADELDGIADEMRVDSARVPSRRS